MPLTRKRSQPATLEHEVGATLAVAPLTAFEALFEQHWARLCGALCRLTGDRGQAEDLALEAFWQLYTRPPADARNLGGWLYRVGLRLGFNALRAERRRLAHELKTLDVGGDTAGDPAQNYEQAQQRRQVRAALAGMPARSAQLLVLRHAGLSYAELAVALEVAPGSVGTLLARAERDFEQRYRKLEGG